MAIINRGGTLYGPPRPLPGRPQSGYQSYGAGGYGAGGSAGGMGGGGGQGGLGGRGGVYSPGGGGLNGRRPPAGTPGGGNVPPVKNGWDPSQNQGYPAAGGDGSDPYGGLGNGGYGGRGGGYAYSAPPAPSYAAPAAPAAPQSGFTNGRLPAYADPNAIAYKNANGGKSMPSQGYTIGPHGVTEWGYDQVGFSGRTPQSNQDPNRLLYHNNFNQAAYANAGGGVYSPGGGGLNGRRPPAGSRGGGAGGGGGGTDINGLIGQYQAAQDAANADNEARYQEGKDVITSGQTAQNTALSSGLAAQQGIVSGLSNTNVTRAQRMTQDELGSQTARLYSMGLANNTGAIMARQGILDRGAERENAARDDNARLALSVQQQYDQTNNANLGNDSRQLSSWIYGKETQGPDVGLLANLLSRPGAAGGQQGYGYGGGGNFGQPGINFGLTGGYGGGGYGGGGGGGGFTLNRPGQGGLGGRGGVYSPGGGGLNGRRPPAGTPGGGNPPVTNGWDPSLNQGYPAAGGDGYDPYGGLGNGGYGGGDYSPYGYQSGAGLDQQYGSGGGQTYDDAGMYDASNGAARNPGDFPEMRNYPFNQPFQMDGRTWVKQTNGQWVATS